MCHPKDDLNESGICAVSGTQMVVEQMVVQKMSANSVKFREQAASECAAKNHPASRHLTIQL